MLATEWRTLARISVIPSEPPRPRREDEARNPWPRLGRSDRARIHGPLWRAQNDTQAGVPSALAR